MTEARIVFDPPRWAIRVAIVAWALGLGRVAGRILTKRYCRLEPVRP